MKIVITFVLLALLAGGALALILRLRADEALAGRVTYVIDGDTVVVRLDSDEAVHVRLIGINTPEIAHFGKPGECFGIRAATSPAAWRWGTASSCRPGASVTIATAGCSRTCDVLGGPADLERTLLVRGAARTLAIAPNVDRAATYAGLEGARAAPVAACGERAPRADLESRR